ncbi:hypothetical protein GCM10027418_27360 [Mariniluteicoccus endophyticus]
MTHVLLVSLHTSPWTALGTGDGGGMNVVVAQQAAALAARGHRVSVATRRFDDAPAAVEVAAGVTLHHLPAGPQTPLPKSRIDDHLDEFTDHLARLDRPDVVHAHHWMSGVAALEAARTWGVPVATSFHSVAAPPGAGLDAGEPAESPRRIPGEQRCVDGSAALITISRAEAATLAERYGAPLEKIRVVAPGVDHDVFTPAAPVGGDDPYLLFAARLQPLKGVDLVVEALGLLAADRCPRLVVAGEVSDDFASYHRDIEAAVADHGLTDRVSYAGSLPRSEFAALMRDARALVVPSRSETFGLVALEAAACGTPVIASDAGGLREAVADGRSGWLVPRESARWAAAIDRLVHDDDAYATLRAGALAYAEPLTWEASARRLAQVYATMVAAHREGVHVTLLDHLISCERVLLSHAHPDDESLSTGALALLLADAGVEVQVVTATRGERGEVVPGALPDTFTGTLEQWRERELATAVERLGVRRHAFLGREPALAGEAPHVYRDSGMRWVTPEVAGPADDATPDAFSVVPVGGVVADLGALVAAWRPDAVVSYDADGGYGHPDHLRMHEAVLAVARRRGLPFVAVTGRDRADEWHDRPELADRLARALDAHRTQLTVEGDEVVHVGGQRQAVETWFGLARRG